MSIGSNESNAVGAQSPFADSLAKTGARTLTGSAWMTAQAIAPYLFTLIVSIVAARVLDRAPWAGRATSRSQCWRRSPCARPGFPRPCPGS